MTDYMKIVIIEFLWLNNRNEGYPSKNARHIHGNTHTHTHIHKISEMKKREQKHVLSHNVSDYGLDPQFNFLSEFQYFA